MTPRRSSCSKERLRRGAWTDEEDRILKNYIKVHGEGKWRTIPIKTGLKRCGKSCRLRWLNYLRPGIKRGNISDEEEQLIITLHNIFGNKWSLIAGKLPGRTDNEIKNYWNTHLRKKIKHQSNSNTQKDSNHTSVMPVEPSDATKSTKNEPNVEKTFKEPAICKDVTDLYSKVSVSAPNKDRLVIPCANEYPWSYAEDGKSWWNSLMGLDNRTFCDQCQASDSEPMPIYNLKNEYDDEVIFEDHIMSDLERLSPDLDFESWALF